MGAGADAQASFAVDLEDGTSGPAGSAADAVARLKKQLEGQNAAMNAANKAMRNLKGGTAAQIVQAKAMEESLKGQKAAIAQTTSSILALGGSLQKTGSGAGSKKLLSMLEQLQKGSKEVGGPVGNFVGRLSSLKEVLAGGAIALGLVAIAAAVVAVTVAVAAGIGMLLKYGIAQSDARRSELLHLEGLTKLRNRYGIAAGSAGEMQAALDKAAGSTSIGRDELGKYEEQLYRTHLRGQNLTDALEAMAITAQVQGEAQAARFAGMAASAAFAGRSVKKLADDVKARLGGIAARQMLSLDVQTKKLHESFERLFSGLKLEGFLQGLQSVTQLFSQNTATGRALKILIEGILQPLVDATAFAGPIVKRFFQGMVIGALVVGIAFLKVRNMFRDAFGDSQALKGIDLATVALYTGVAAVTLLTGGVAALAIAFGLLASPLIAAGVAVYNFYSLLKNAYATWESIDWSGLGKGIVDGIVNGLKDGAKYVIDAVRNLGTSAMNALKGKLDIHSPSKVFAKLGRAIPMGVEAGIDVGSPSLNRSVGGMVDSASYSPRLAAPDLAAGLGGGVSPSLAPSAPSAPSSSSSVTINELHVHTQSDKPAEVAFDFKRELERALESLAVHLGAPLPGGG